MKVCRIDHVTAAVADRIVLVEGPSESVGRNKLKIVTEPLRQSDESAVVSRVCDGA